MQNLMSVQQLADAYPAFTQGQLRWYIHRAANNGLAESGAIVRIGRRVYIDVDRFGDWIKSIQEHRQCA